MQEPRLLIDNAGTLVRLVIEEDDKSGKMIARGEFAAYNRPTENHRLYPKSLWEREIGRIGKKMEGRQVFGELDHPADGKTKLSRVSHILTNLQVEEDGRVTGAAEIVDTSKGKELKALLTAGAVVGVSSRGFGTTIPDGSGNEVVSEDYRLMTFDFVADPADETATPRVYSEDKELETEMSSLTIEVLKEKHPDIVKQIAAEAVAALKEQDEKGKKDTKSDDETAKKEKDKIESLREEFRTQLLDKVTEMKEQLREEARGEMLSDPDVAMSKKVVEQLKDMLRPFILPEDANSIVEQKDSEAASMKKKIANLETENTGLKKNYAELESVARKVGYQLHLEKKLAAAEDANQVRQVLKDQTFESTEQIDARIVEVRAMLKEQDAKKKADDTEKEKLQKENKQLQEALAKALETGKALGLRAYAEKRVASLPQAPALREMMESTEFHSEAEVDAFVAKGQKATPVSEEYTSVREKLTKGQVHKEAGVVMEGKPVEENKDQNKSETRGQIVEDVLGVPVDQLKKMMPTN